MRQSKLFGKTLREAPKDEISANAKFLERGGFVYKNSAGVYSYLPLGWQVLNKIANIIREEMNAIGGQELFMPALVEKKYMEPTGRWNLDIGFLLEKGHADKRVMMGDFVLGWTHEEVLTAISTKFINSYKDLPIAAYQIQSKFRREERPKSGLLRGREFMMKDLYSFHESEEDLLVYYDKVAEAYQKIFNRCGLKAFYTLAAGGLFTEKFTHEFQVLSDVGEDLIYVCSQCEYAENKEISKLKENDKCQKCGGEVVEKKSIEVGNIFNQGTKYSEALGLYFLDNKENRRPVVMGSYGIGLGRVMGTIVEVHHDEKGILWPEEVAPFKIHLIELKGEGVKSYAQEIYKDLLAKGISVLYDDREEKSAGEKFADADLIGIPLRVVISEKTLEKKGLEIKRRSEKEAKIVSEKDFIKKL